MPDWDRIVAEKLPKLKLPETREAEIRCELAGHFAEVCADFVIETGSEKEAMRQTMEEIGDWRALARRIRITEKLGVLNSRVRTLWLPGLLGVAAGMLVPRVVFLFISWPHGRVADALNTPELVMAFLGLLMLPSGFVSAGVAWYMGASGLQRLGATLLPLAIVWIALALVPLGTGAPLRAALLQQLQMMPYLAADLAGLVMGGLPFLFRDQRLSLLPNRWLA